MAADYTLTQISSILKSYDVEGELVTEMNFDKLSSHPNWELDDDDTYKGIDPENEGNMMVLITSDWLIMVGNVQYQILALHRHKNSVNVQHWKCSMVTKNTPKNSYWNTMELELLVQKPI